MNLQEMIKLWPQYQSWLKENNINMSNLEEKAGGLIKQLKEDPQNYAKVQQTLSDPRINQLAKNFNISEDVVAKAKSAFGNATTDNTKTLGNLTQEQLAMIKKLKK